MAGFFKKLLGGLAGLAPEAAAIAAAPATGGASLGALGKAKGMEKALGLGSAILGALGQASNRQIPQQMPMLSMKDSFDQSPQFQSALSQIGRMG